MTEFKLLSNIKLKELKIEINKYLNDGWKLVAGIEHGKSRFDNKYYWLQAISKKYNN